MAYARSHTMTLLCAAKVRSRICVCGKEQLEVAEWCLVSPRQVRNWIRKDTNISVMNLYSLADCPECKTDDRKRQLRRRRRKRNRPLLEEIAGSFVCSLRLTR